MAGPAERITRDLGDIFPYAACLPCLAKRLGVAEFDARHATQAPVLRGDLRIVRATC
jgi:hypothetical protein